MRGRRLRSVAAVTLILAVAQSCGSDFRPRPDDPCFQYDGDQQGCWGAVDDEGQECLYLYAGDPCEVDIVEVGCFSQSYVNCATNTDCADGYACFGVELSGCFPTEDGECEACGSGRVGLCFLDDR